MTGLMQRRAPLMLPQVIDRAGSLFAGKTVTTATVEGEAIAVNHRLFAEQIEFIVNNAADEACVVAEKDATVTSQLVRDHLAGRVASWWIPETIHVVDQIPKTATGKFSEKALREHRPLQTPTRPAA